MHAIKITTTDQISVVPVPVPEPTWKGMGQLVGGYFEHVRPWGLMNLQVPEKEKLCMIVNGEGRIIGLKPNLVGSLLYNDTPTPTGYKPVVGDILIMAEGFKNGEPDIVGLTNEQIIVVFKALKSKFNFLKEKKCRVCGCTDIEACPGGCYWVEEDLCSECVETGEEIEIEEEDDETN